MSTCNPTRKAILRADSVIDAYWVSISAIPTADALGAVFKALAARFGGSFDAYVAAYDLRMYYAAHPEAA